jgi:hypothetical protein
VCNLLVFLKVSLFKDKVGSLVLEFDLGHSGADPTLQSVQAEAPDRFEKVLAGQFRQVADEEAPAAEEYFPILHCSQDEAPAKEQI